LRLEIRGLSRSETRSRSISWSTAAAPAAFTTRVALTSWSHATWRHRHGIPARFRCWSKRS